MSDIIGSKDFSTIKPFAFWTQHVLPLVYGDEISYMETLDKVVKLLNELIKNNNKLPDYIQKIVEEYITGGPLEEVLSGILANFILNVKYPPTGITPAKGDGTANDYEAIQGCIDYAANMGGGVVYFPFGKYLTSKLTLKPGVSLIGFSKYCTNIVLTGGETGSLISGTVNDCGIYNLTLDGNMSIQVNNVDVVTLTGYNIQLMNVILTDGYTLFNIEKTGDNIEVNNVEFRYAVESMLRIGGNVGSVNADSVTFGSLSTIRGVAAIISDSDNDVITGIVSNKALPLFAELDGNNNVLEGKVASTNLIAGDGHGNVYDFYCRTKNETYSGDVGETVHGNKSVHIGGTYTKAVDSNSTESVDGTKSELVTGVSSASYMGDRTISGKNIIETVSGKKAINGMDIVLNPTNPLTYKKPTNYDNMFNSIPMKDPDGNAYNVAVLNKPNIAYSTLTVEEMKTINFTEGCIFCCGMESIGDFPPLSYNILPDGVADGGSVIALNNGYYAHALFPEYVYPEWFDIKNSDPSTVKNTKWDNLINYCENNSKYIKLLPHTYELNETLYTRVPIIGCNSTSTHFNPYITKTKPIRTNNENVSCIKAVSPFTYKSPNDVTAKALIILDIRKNDKSFNGTNYPQNAVISNFAVDANGITESGLCVPYYNNAEFKELEIGGSTKYDIQFGLLWMCNINNVVVYSDKSIRGLFWDSSFIPSSLIGTTNVFNNMHFISVSTNYIPIEMNIFYTTIFNCLAFDVFNDIDCFIKTRKGTLTLNQPHFEPRDNVTVGCLIDCLGDLNLTIDLLSLQFTATSKLNYLFKLLNGNISIVNSDITNGVNGMITPLYLYTGVANLVVEMNMLGLITVPATYQTAQSGNMLIIFKSRGGYYYLSRLKNSETTNMTKLYGA